MFKTSKIFCKKDLTPNVRLEEPIKSLIYKRIMNYKLKCTLFKNLGSGTCKHDFKIITKRPDLSPGKR